MNSNILRLYEISQKPSRKIIGLMSGTSLDGLDIAFCEIANYGLKTSVVVEHFTTINYNDDFKHEMRSVFSQEQISLQKVCLLNEWIGIQHARMINNCLKDWNIESGEIDLIASHGQTIYHAPKSAHQIDKFSNGTLQIGDGDHLAVNTGIITISDFRQKHIAGGGEGAPLAIYGDYLLFNKKGENRILLNIGGIANFTWLPDSGKMDEIFSTDTGPGNCLSDALVIENIPDQYYDEDAIIARQGEVNAQLLQELKSDNFFLLSGSKSTGPELFSLNYLKNAIKRTGLYGLALPDILCTLLKFTADTIGEAILKRWRGEKGINIFVSGGGTQNPLLMEHLLNQLPAFNIKNIEELGINPAAKEAVLFAVLANECVGGDSSLFKTKNNLIPAISMGKISFPS